MVFDKTHKEVASVIVESGGKIRLVVFARKENVPVKDLYASTTSAMEKTWPRGCLEMDHAGTKKVHIIKSFRDWL